MPLTTPIIITRTIAQHVAHRDAERANYAADLQIGRTPWEIEDSLARLAAAEGALSDALLALYRPELLAGSAVPDVAAVGAPCAICRRCRRRAVRDLPPRAHR